MIICERCARTLPYRAKNKEDKYVTVPLPIYSNKKLCVPCARTLLEKLTDALKKIDNEE